MNISMIVAMGKNRVIGKDNGMPWVLPNDLQYFKEVTMHHPIIMGRKCFESIGRPLPCRRNIVLSHTAKSIEGCEIFPSVDAVLEEFKNQDQIFVIGGGQVYQQFLPITNKLYITLIDEEFEGDTLFPEVDYTEWQLVSQKEGTIDQEHSHKHTFYVYERLAGK